MASNKKDTAAAVESTEAVDTAKVTVDAGEELVEYMAPVILGKADRSIFVSVNGENVRIQRGKKVSIKRKFVEVLEHAAEQEVAAEAYMDAAQKGSAKALADM